MPRAVARIGRVSIEVVVALVAALGFTFWSRTIHDNPIRRVGQVSALGALGLRFAVLVVGVVVALILVRVRGNPRWMQRAARWSCAAVAGLVAGFLAGGQVFVLRGTPWPLNAARGDNGALVLMAREALATGSTHSIYPPAIPYAMAWATRHFHLDNPALALKPIFIVLLAVTGPAAYVAWRIVVGPFAALGLALATVLPQTAPYKPYSMLVLLVTLPLMIAFVRALRRSRRAGVRMAAVRGLAFGLGFGLLFLLYSGWTVWFLPGAAAALLIAFPWRKGRSALLRGGGLVAGAVVGFVAPTMPYLLVVRHAVALKDSYCSPITLAQPAYIGPNAYSASQWNKPGEWPVLGPFGGLDVYTLLLLAGMGVAIALGLRRPLVFVPVTVFGGAWLTRFWIVHHLQRDQATQLFPRTTNLIQVCLAALVVVAVLLVAQRVRQVWTAMAARTDGFGLGGAATRRLHGPVAAVLVLALVGGMSASALTDQYMPEAPKFHTGGELAWFAQTTTKPDYMCPRFAPGHLCAPPNAAPVPLPANADYATLKPSATFRNDCEYPWRRTILETTSPTSRVLPGY